jgi:hypothetical protein
MVLAIRRLICEFMHDGFRWPIRGHMECKTCLRKWRTIA